LGRFQLPVELRTFYAWHDGHEYGAGLMPGYQMDPLASVVESQLRYAPGLLEFPPQWVMLGTMNGDEYLVAVGAYRMEIACPLMLYDPESGWLCLPWASIADFALSVRDCFAEDVYKRDDNGHWIVLDHEAERQIWRNHYRPTVIDGLALPWEMDPNDSDAWPKSWRLEAGINEEDEVARPSTQIAEFAAAGQPCTISGRVVWLSGTAFGSVVEADDGTGQIIIGVPRTIPGARFLRMRERFQWDVEPGVCPPDFAFLPRASSVTAVAIRMRRLDRAPGSEEPDYRVTDRR
jgi:hypothetical protein